MKQVQPGAGRSEVDYAWPRQLRRPLGDVRIVYLDLNHWIQLAKAATGHSDGERHRPVLDALRAAGERIVIPLSAVHYMEMAGIRAPRQRFDVAAVMEELSAYGCLMSGPTVTALELDAALARVAGTSERHAPLPLIGRGGLQAFGKVGGLRVRSSDGDVTDALRRDWPGGAKAFDAWLVEAELTLDRALLRGPTDDEVAKLEALGWDPTFTSRAAAERAEQQRHHSRVLDDHPQWRPGRLRDVVAARYLALEIPETFDRVLKAHNLDPSDVASSPERLRALTDSMPSGDTWITLQTAAHRNPETPWSPNDIFDIDALSFAVPYCDIVLTEKHACHVLHAAKLPARTDTEVIATPEQLLVALTPRSPRPNRCSSVDGTLGRPARAG